VKLTTSVCPPYMTRANRIKQDIITPRFVKAAVHDSSYAVIIPKPYTGAILLFEIMRSRIR
jgi:hypothetical protein